jgi:hypothetical protein
MDYELPEIPSSYLQVVILIGMLILTYLGFNHFIQASLAAIIGYLFGREMEKKQKKLMGVH